MLLSRLPRLRDERVDPRAAFAGTFHINESLSQLQGTYAVAAAGAVPDLVPCEIYCHSLSDRSILGPDLAGTDAQTLTLFGLHLPARLFREDNEARRAEALAATLRSLDSVLAEPIEDVLLRGPDGRPCLEARTPVDLEQDLALPGGNIFHRSLQWPWAETPSRSAPGASRRSTSGCWSAARVPAAAAASAASRVTTRRRRSWPAHRRARCPARTPGRAGSAAWIVSRSSCSAPSRSGTSASSGSGSPTCSVSSSRWRSPRPSSRGRSPRASASTAAPSRGSPGSTRRTCSAAPTPPRSRRCPGAATTPAPPGCSATSCCRTSRPASPTPATCSSARWPRRPTSGSPSTPTPRSSSSCSKQPMSPATPPVPVDQAGYFDHVPHGTAHDFRRAAITMLESMGISVEFSHHEGARGRTRSTCATPTRSPRPTTS